jgi:hypothetical protein
MSNYRPMSCVNGFSELSEKVVYKELVNDFQLNSILANEQFGLRRDLAHNKLTNKLVHDITCIACTR